MGKNIFFEPKEPFLLSEIFSELKQKNKIKISDVKILQEASGTDLTFLDSIDYADIAKSTKAAYCLTTEKLKNFLPRTCTPVLVENVLFALCKVTKKLYPSADVDTPDKTIKAPKKSSFLKVKFGNNVLIGKKCKIGRNSFIGSNTIIENNVSIGTISINR